MRKLNKGRILLGLGFSLSVKISKQYPMVFEGTEFEDKLEVSHYLESSKSLRDIVDISSVDYRKNTAEKTINYHNLFSQLHFPKNWIRQSCHASKLVQRLWLYR